MISSYGLLWNYVQNNIDSCTGMSPPSLQAGPPFLLIIILTCLNYIQQCGYIYIFLSFYSASLKITKE